MLTVEKLTKNYRSGVAVNQLSFTVPDGQITGFLGPNGAGKSTTMRMCVGLETPSSGTATLDGQNFRSLRHPSSMVGCLLESDWFNPTRSARNHLRYMAMAANLPKSRINEVLEQVGIVDVANRKVGGFSLGMRQRLGLACALLGNPQHLVLDEPLNGLDPEGVHWMRDMMRRLAQEGRSLLVSSHMLSEMALTADRLVVIGKGRLVSEGSLDSFLGAAGKGVIEVCVNDPARLIQALSVRGLASSMEGNTIIIPAAATGGSELTTEHVGALCLELGIVISALGRAKASLEDVFLKATADSVEYQTVNN